MARSGLKFEGGSLEYSEMHESAPYWLYVCKDGWIGPEALVANATVPRLPLASQYAEADPAQTQRILDSMHSFLTLVNTIWKTGQQGTSSMGFQFDYQFVRWEELIYSLQWLYDTHPRGTFVQVNNDQLTHTDSATNSGYSWKTNWFTPAVFPKQAVPSNKLNMQTHGVNTAVGTFSADEHIAGLNPSRGTELCAIVEQIFSLATIYSILGNNSAADRVEKLAHQYDQEAYPKFWSHSFMTSPANNSLIHTFLGPATFSGMVGTNNNVQVSVSTLYPFGLTFSYSVAASRAFAFQIRIPEWAKNSQSTIAVNEAKAAAIKPDATTSLQTIQVAAGTATIQMTLHAPLQIDLRTNNAVAIIVVRSAMQSSFLTIPRPLQAGGVDMRTSRQLIRRGGRRYAATGGALHALAAAQDISALLDVFRVTE
ncbi:hypothetical protein GALMADRAFT_1355748 [Galerina marginata CBS 339.88]|uniref:Uncharacterized protein n=1 Tax=Galerina marginata (strain CBS 339.88) TaxID=685588 RepID=A0A067SIQ9_GALM3|nr:hypothetical protein GALMADRAFT_1355748 [Galerina marginata CBS 339.88]